MPRARSRGSGPPLVAAAAALVVALAPGVSGAQGTATYDVTHAFTFAPQGNVFQVTHLWRTFANAQPPGGPQNTGGTLNVPAGGGVYDNQSLSVGPLSTAFAHSNATVNGYAAGPPITGSIRANGSATAVVGGSANAFSSSTVRVRGGTKLKNGRIRWGPTVSSSVSGSASARKRDPISFDILDLDTGASLFGTLLSIDIDNNGGSFDWDSNAGTLSMNAQSLHMAIDMTSPYTTTNGTLDFLVSGGTIVTSSGSGIFAGLLPSVGLPGNFTVPFLPIDIDYSLPDFNGDALDIGMTFGGDGMATVTPEPSAAALVVSGAMLLSVAVRLRRRGHLA